MKNNVEQNEAGKIISRYKHSILVVSVPLLVFALFLVYIFFLKSNYSSKSDIVIRIAAAGILNKEPNDLTDEDFQNITSLNLDGKELKDIRLLSKFTNLEEIYIANAHPPKPKIHRWMDLLEKLHIYNFSKKEFISLSPLEKLTNLKIVTLIGSDVENIEPLAELKNLKHLNLNETKVRNIEPIKDLVNLEGLYLRKTLVSDIEPVKSLINLKSLYLDNTGVSNLEPVKNLANLLQLRFTNTRVTNLDSLYSLTNLQKLYIGIISPIKMSQAENLQKVLQNLYIDILNENIAIEPSGIFDITNQTSPPADDFFGPIHYWPFDENQGNIFKDVVSGKDGQIYGAKWTNGVSGSSLKFDGIDDYATLPDNKPIWLPENDFSISVWVFYKGDILNGNNMVLDLNYSRTNELGYNILFSNRSTVFQLHTDSKVNEDLNVGSGINFNQWNHICVVRKSDNQSIYINGRLSNFQKCSPVPIRFVEDYDDNKVNIGRYTTVLAQPRYFLNGRIDELKIFNRAISPNEIAKMFNSKIINQ